MQLILLGRQIVEYCFLIFGSISRSYYKYSFFIESFSRTCWHLADFCDSYAKRIVRMTEMDVYTLQHSKWTRKWYLFILLSFCSRGIIWKRCQRSSNQKVTQKWSDISAFTTTACTSLRSHDIWVNKVVRDSRKKIVLPGSLFKWLCLCCFLSINLHNEECSASVRNVFIDLPKLPQLAVSFIFCSSKGLIIRGSAGISLLLSDYELRECNYTNATMGRSAISRCSALCPFSSCCIFPLFSILEPWIF